MGRRHFAAGLLAAGLFWLSPVEAQNLAGDHRIWIDGAPAGASADVFDPRYHYPIPGPTIPEPAGLNRERWAALVFDNWEPSLPPGPFRSSSRSNQTRVIARHVVPTIGICLQSPDESHTGERLVPYDAAWWRRQIERWTGLQVTGVNHSFHPTTIRIPGN